MPRKSSHLRDVILELRAEYKFARGLFTSLVKRRLARTYVNTCNVKVSPSLYCQKHSEGLEIIVLDEFNERYTLFDVETMKQHRSSPFEKKPVK